MKRIISLLLWAAIVLSLFSGCGKKEPAAAPVETVPPIAETQPPATQPEAPTELPTLEEQFACIAGNASVWLDNPEYGERPMYTVTDLDGNGLLEVIRSLCSGTGLFTTSQIYEVAPAGKTLNPIQYGVPEGDSEPDIQYGYVVVYEKDGRSWYIFDDIMRNGAAEHYTTHYAVSKSGSEVTIETLCSSRTTYNTQTDTVDEQYFGPDGTEVTSTEFDSMESTRFEGYERRMVGLQWEQLDGSANLERFARNAYWLFRATGTGQSADYTVNIYTDPKSSGYQDLGNAATCLKGCENADTALRFTVAEEVQVTLEYGEWLTVADYFHPISEVFSILAQPGTVYEFPAFLAEGRPDYRLRADKLDHTSVWYLNYDGQGENSVVEMFYEEPQPLLPEERSPILSICQAYAGMVTAAGNVETLLEPDFYWKTLANAITLQTWHATDPSPDGKIYLTQWLMDRYILAMFPMGNNLSAPRSGEPVIYDPEHYERYVVQDGLYFDDGSTQIDSVAFDEYDRIVVTVSVWTQVGQRYVLVYLEPDYAPGSENPFGYYILNATIARG